MAYITVKALKDGPYEVAGGAKVLNYTGKEYAESAIEPLYLCRCGAPKDKPFVTAATTKSASSRNRGRVSATE